MCGITWVSTEFEVAYPDEFPHWLRSYWPEANFMHIKDNTFQIGPNMDFYEEYMFGDHVTNLPEYRLDPSTETLTWMGDHDQGIPGEDTFIEELSHRVRWDATCIIQVWSYCDTMWIAQGFATALVINGGPEDWRDRVKWVSLSSECVRIGHDLVGGRRLLMAG
jgi:hypothetical protein